MPWLWHFGPLACQTKQNQAKPSHFELDSVFIHSARYTNTCGCIAKLSCYFLLLSLSLFLSFSSFDLAFARRVDDRLRADDVITIRLWRYLNLSMPPMRYIVDLLLFLSHSNLGRFYVFFFILICALCILLHYSMYLHANAVRYYCCLSMPQRTTDVHYSTCCLNS